MPLLGDFMTGLLNRRLASVAGLLALVAAVVWSTLITAGEQSYPAASEWRQWGGPDRNFMSDATGLADSWGGSGPPLIWSRPLGLGHSAIVVDDGMLYTLYRPGQETTRRGGWESREFVIAMDAETGLTRWEHEYPSKPLHFQFGAGPHATPLVVDNLVFTAGTNKQLHALDKKTGQIVWSHDLVAEYASPPTLIRPAVKAGFACSPLAYKDTIILQVGGPGQAVMAFNQSDGALIWKSGDFLTAQAASILIDVDGETQLVVLGGQNVNGLDPDTGRILWSHPHDTQGDMNNSTPIWGPDNILFISSAYDKGSRAIRITRQGGQTDVEDLWFNDRLALMFANAIRLDYYIYGTDGKFGPAFLTGLDVRTGEIAWQERGFGRSSLVYADGKAIIMDEDGDLVLARLSPSGVDVLSRASIFNTTSWTVPTLVGKTLYARDREKIVALDMGSR